MSLPAEIWLEILKRCDPITYIRMLSVSKCIPNDSNQYANMKQQYYKLKDEIHLGEIKREGRGIQIALRNGLGKRLEFKLPKFQGIWCNGISSREIVPK
jgi:hypothetical protein